jgi:hypothetical protein
LEPADGNDNGSIEGEYPLMKRSRQVFLMTVVLVLCAGVVVGRLSAKLAVELPTPPPGHPPSWLADQLGLSTDQRQQMDAIWAEVKQQMGNDRDRRREFDRERDEAIQNLLSVRQKLAYQEIYDEYHTKRQQMETARDALIKSAEERSRAMLSDSQKLRWDQLSKDMHGHRSGPGSGPGFSPGPMPGRGGGFGPTSQWSNDHGSEMEPHY